MHTYNTGSPLPSAHFRAQLQDTQHIRIEGVESRKTAQRIANDATELVHPVLCVSVWEHSYIVDWRVQGKDQYLEAWWDRIDWNRIANISGVNELFSQSKQVRTTPERRFGDFNRPATMQQGM
jgi:Fe-Mn family superoxide dismutase